MDVLKKPLLTQILRAVAGLALGLPLAAYALIIGGHLMIEIWFTTSTLVERQSIAEKVWEVDYLHDPEGTRYCLYNHSNEEAVEVASWREGCDTTVRRITIYSRLISKYWAVYLDADDVVRFKRSWTTT